MTFVLSRVFVFLIMSQLMPNLYGFVQGSRLGEMVGQPLRELESASSP